MTRPCCDVCGKGDARLLTEGERHLWPELEERAA